MWRCSPAQGWARPLQAPAAAWPAAPALAMRRALLAAPEHTGLRLLPRDSHCSSQDCFSISGVLPAACNRWQ